MELTLTQKKEIGFIAIRGSLACYDFNTKINLSIKRLRMYEDSYALKTLNEYITCFKTHLLEYLDMLDYRVLELCYEMYSVDIIYNDMKNIDTLMNDTYYNFISLLLEYTRRILNIRNSVVALGCDEESCKKAIGKMVSLLGVDKKYVR